MREFEGYLRGGDAQKIIPVRTLLVITDSRRGYSDSPGLVE
ncbi:MAG: hypothetical protein ACE5KH_01860 [Candidatus Geothermarchaeales archaeon]